MSGRAHSHYFKDVAKFREVDVYRVLSLFGVTDQAIGHAIKKLLVAGGRGGGKDISRDIQEAIDTLQRWQEMREEDEGTFVDCNDEHPSDIFTKLQNIYKYDEQVLWQLSQTIEEAWRAARANSAPSLIPPIPRADDPFPPNKHG